MRKIFSVSEINRYVKRMFEQDDLLHGVIRPVIFISL